MSECVFFYLFMSQWINDFVYLRLCHEVSCSVIKVFFVKWSCVRLYIKLAIWNGWRQRNY